jgi:hypothetical protein
MYKTFSNGDEGTIFPDLKKRGEVGMSEDKIGGNESFCFRQCKNSIWFLR